VAAKRPADSSRRSDLKNLLIALSYSVFGYTKREKPEGFSQLTYICYPFFKGCVKGKVALAMLA
jgi:hypothetical protein